MQKIGRKRYRKKLTVCIKFIAQKLTHRLYFKMEEKGRVLLIIEAAHKLEIIDIADCLRTKRK
jgi:arginine decarboxylase-like protein